MRTQVGIVGAGPAGLLLGHLLHLRGIDSVILESRSRAHILQRVRAGVLEDFTVDLLTRAGLGDRLKREGIREERIFLGFNGVWHPIDFNALVGKSVWIYAQNEVLADLIDARMKTCRPLLFEAQDVQVCDFDTPQSKIMFGCDGRRHELVCDFVVGCDGFHGVCRPSIPPGSLQTFEKVYPLAWLGILAEAASDVPRGVVYNYSERGFALFNMRTSKLARIFIQVPPEDIIESWPEERIWEEATARLTKADGWCPPIGPVVWKGFAPVRSFVAEPMRCGQLFLAGDSAHILPPMGAKGLNLAAADVCVLAQGFAEFFKAGSERLLHAYSDIALRRAWRYQRFSWWMTTLFHRLPDENAFDHRRHLVDLERVIASRAVMTELAETYVGLPLDVRVDI